MQTVRLQKKEKQMWSWCEVEGVRVEVDSVGGQGADVTARPLSPPGCYS